MNAQVLARCESGKCGVSSHVVGTAAQKKCAREGGRQKAGAAQAAISSPPKLAVASIKDADSLYPVDLSKAGEMERKWVERVLEEDYLDGLSRAEYIVAHGGIERVSYMTREEGSGRTFRAYYSDPDEGSEYMEFDLAEERIVNLFEAEDSTPEDMKLLLDYEKKLKASQESLQNLKYVRKNHSFADEQVAHQEYTGYRNAAQEAANRYTEYKKANGL